MLNKLDVELHLPRYNYCGLGTKLTKRIARGDTGINQLDYFCKQHDIIYSLNPDTLSVRREADKILAKKSLGRVFARDAQFGERLAPLGVTAAMRLEKKLGAGLVMKPKVRGGSLKKKKRGNRRVKKRRVISVPQKMGGALPLIPLFSSVSALAGGAATIARAINQARSNKRQLEENVRHNKHMEAISMDGKGFRMRPWGYGFRTTRQVAAGCGLKKRQKKKKFKTKKDCKY